MPRWSLLRLSMMISITFILDPPLGRYSSDTCVRLVTRGLHPAVPSMVAPAAPAPATLRKSLRVRVRFFTHRLRERAGDQAPRARRDFLEHAVFWCLSARPSSSLELTAGDCSE